MSNEDNNNNDDDLLPHQVVVFTRMVRAQLAAEKEVMELRARVSELERGTKGDAAKYWKDRWKDAAGAAYEKAELAERLQKELDEVRRADPGHGYWNRKYVEEHQENGRLRADIALLGIASHEKENVVRRLSDAVGRNGGFLVDESAWDAAIRLLDGQRLALEEQRFMQQRLVEERDTAMKERDELRELLTTPKSAKDGLLDDYDPVPGLVAHGVMSDADEHDCQLEHSDIVLSCIHCGPCDASFLRGLIRGRS